MSALGTVESLWRYPVKSMAAEEMPELFAGFAGVYGDRLFAFRTSAGGAGFPYFTARMQPQMLRYQPRFRFPEKAMRPVNLREAESIGSGATPLFANADELMVDVETPSGETFAIDDPALREELRAGLEFPHELSLLRSERALTDCRPLSLFSLQSAQALARETGFPTDKRRFRASVYLDLHDATGFQEDAFVGRSLRLGEKVVVAVLQRDARCMIVNLDPDTGASEPKVLKQLAHKHDASIGVYAAVLVEGMVRKGDPVELLDR